MNIFIKILKYIFFDKNQRDLNRLKKKLNGIKEISNKISSLSNNDLRLKTFFFKNHIIEQTKKHSEDIRYFLSKKNKYKNRENFYYELNYLKKKLYKKEQKILDDILLEAFLVVKETAKRFKNTEKIIVKATELDYFLIKKKKSYIKKYDENKVIWNNNWIVLGKNFTWNMIHYYVQLIGGIVLHEGKIAEMATGEGKTLVATLAIYLNALTGRGVHIVTVNDYLSKRDSYWMAPIMEFLGLSVDCIDHYPPNTIERKNSYQADIVYGTNNEFGFDYLRDNIAKSSEDLVQRELNYAIIDEVDSVLIDDARTPLIISGSINEKYNKNKYFKTLKFSIENILYNQKLYIKNIFLKTKNLIKSGKLKDAGIELYKMYRGFPIYKPLISFLSEKNIRNLLQKTESIYIQDNQRDMHKIDKYLYFVIDEKNKTVEFTDKGIKYLSNIFNESDFFILPDIDILISKLELENISKTEKTIKKNDIINKFLIKSEKIHIINQLLKAYTLFEKNIDYIIINKQVKIVDEQTGRIMEGRRYSDGLHQALEAKENVKIESSSQTFATITLQNYFRMYNKLSGMTGTAETESGEFWQIYKLDVVVIPTHKKTIRKDYQDLVFKTIDEKYNAIIEKIIELSQKFNRPVLVGTTSVETSEFISRILSYKQIPHNVLNAKLHKKEAEIISKAGLSSMVTIATNMAGRGTDIKLSKNVKNFGGLAVIGTERHDSRRIDRQLRGRSGRQGDPGSSQFYLSLEDNLMRLFIGSNRLIKLMDSFGYKKGDVIQHSLVSKSIERAQKKVEENNFGIRKRLLEYDNVMNLQRKIIYKKRKNALLGRDVEFDILNSIYIILENIFSKNNINDINHELKKVFNYTNLDLVNNNHKILATQKKILLKKINKNIIKHYFIKKIKLSSMIFNDLKNIIYENNIEKIKISFYYHDKIFNVSLNLKNTPINNGDLLVNELEKVIILNIIDNKWKEHLRYMDDLRTSVQNAIYEQKDPLLIYKEEAFGVLKHTINKINLEILYLLFRIDNMYKKNEYYGYNYNKININRNTKIEIRCKLNNEIKRLKFKHAENLIKTGEWVIN